MPPPFCTAVAEGDASLPNRGGEQRAESLPPQADGLVADINATFCQQVLDVA
jgi:hypothetical protein